MAVNMDAWEIWEQLLLVNLVYKHIDNIDWNYIAGELDYYRTAPPEAVPVTFTGDNCNKKFRELILHLDPDFSNGSRDELDHRAVKKLIHSLNQSVAEENRDHMLSLVEMVLGIAPSDKCESSREMEEIKGGEGNNEEGVDFVTYQLSIFLDSLRLDKHGSVFAHRLPSQETEKYNTMIKEHMDLITIRGKLEQGAYKNQKEFFFGDLLLLCENALFFFNKDSGEYKAAKKLRKMVKRHMKNEDKWFVIALPAKKK